MPDENMQELARSVARAYILDTKGWKNTDFDIEVLEERPDGIVVVDAVYAADLLAKGSNLSVQLQVDVARRVVVRELAYQ